MKKGKVALLKIVAFIICVFAGCSKIENDTGTITL